VPVARRELLDHELVEDALDVLEVAHVAARAEDGVFADRMQTLDVAEAREGAVGCCMKR
jgi:hypothetical protein